MGCEKQRNVAVTVIDMHTDALAILLSPVFCVCVCVCG